MSNFPFHFVKGLWRRRNGWIILAPPPWTERGICSSCLLEEEKSKPQLLRQLALAQAALGAASSPEEVRAEPGKPSLGLIGLHPTGVCQHTWLPFPPRFRGNFPSIL